jgi:hypothetical protein
MLEERGLERWTDIMEKRAKFTKESDFAYACLIPPNQHSVYPEHLPDDVELSDRRPVNQLLEHLRSEGVEVPMLYPLEQIREARSVRPTYGPVDSHWNDWGAFMGYQALCDELEGQGVALRRLSEDDLTWDEVDARGDLGIKCTPPETAVEPQASIVRTDSRLLSDNRIRNRGRMLEYESDAPSKVLVFGESFGYVLVKYLSETFGRTVYVHMPEIFDPEVIDKEEPDAVVTIINERFLPRMPGGSRRTLAQSVAEKLERGDVLSDAAARRHKARNLRGHLGPDDDED